MRLSIICVTRCEPHAPRFLREMVELGARLRAELVIAADGTDALAAMPSDLLPYTLRVGSRGFIESVLDEVIAFTRGEYVLRLDDDERCSAAMVEWLAAEEYLKAPHWSFPTANLWTPHHLILNPPLWPNFHERLSVRAMAGGRPSRPHGRTPHGRGEIAPVVLEHWKFVVKPLAQREEIARRYDALRPGAGTGQQLPYNLPERAYESLTVARVGDGHAGRWVETVSLPIALPEAAEA